MKSYIGVHIDGYNVFAFHVYKSKIELHFSRSQKKDFKDPEDRVVYIKNSKKYWNQHVCSFTLNSADDISYAVLLARQALKRFDEQNEQ